MNKITLPEFTPGRYRHYKGGLYELVAVASHSETLEPMIVYKSLSNGGWWVRPASMWNETVTVDGKSVTRFTLVETK